MVRFVSNKQSKEKISVVDIPHSSTGCDVIDAVIVAMDEIQQKLDICDFKGKTKATLQREIIILSDFAQLTCRDVDDLPSIIGGLKEYGYVIKSIGHPDSTIGDEPPAPTEPTDTVMTVVQQLCKETAGRMMSFEDAHQVITEFSIVEPSAAKIFQGPLEIGSLQV